MNRTIVCARRSGLSSSLRKPPFAHWRLCPSISEKSHTMCSGPGASLAAAEKREIALVLLSGRRLETVLEGYRLR